MFFEALGALRVTRAGAELFHVSARKPRLTLAVLLAEHDRVVGFDRLTDALWDARPPRSARVNLQQYVHVIRAAIGAERVLTRPHGYLLVTDGAVDTAEFTRLAEAGRAALDAGEAREAVRLLDEALGLWRGPAFEGFTDAASIAGHAARLEDRCHDARRARAEAAMLLGEDAGAIPALTALIETRPWDEEACGLLMTALHRRGHQAEALRVFRDLRATLAEELGADPRLELRELHGRILRDHTGPPPPAPPTPGGGFMGRAGCVAAVEGIARGIGARHETIVLIMGMGGIGKTALAVHAMRRMPGLFPGGRIMVNLRGFDPRTPPLTATEALGELLTALRVPAEEMPADLTGRRDVYRELTGRRRLLIVLDNAADAEQVRALVPSGAGCLTLVTSRRRLTGLVAVEGAHPLTLPALDAGEARALLASRVGEERLAAEPAAAREITAICGGLPLALVIIGARAALEPGLPLAAIAAELRSGLAPFTDEDPMADLRAVFGWSRRALSETAADTLALLGAAFGPDISPAAAASLTGLGEPEARAALTELTDAHLLSEESGRYAMHDLVRAYAAELAGALGGDVRERAVRRLLDHCLHGSHAAALAFVPHRMPIPLPPAAEGAAPVAHTGRDAAVAWWHAERAVLLAAVEHAAGAGLHDHAAGLSWSLWDHLRSQNLIREWAGVLRAALPSAARCADPGAEADHHRALGMAHRRLGRFTDAAAHFETALRGFAEAGETIRLGHTHLGLASLMEHLGRWDDAVHHGERALAEYDEAGHATGRGSAMNSLAFFHTHRGEHTRALEYAGHALALQRELGEKRAEALTLDTIATIHMRLGDPAAALAPFAAAAELFAELAETHDLAETLEQAGDACEALGDAEGAAAQWTKAMAVHGDGSADAARLKAKLGDLHRRWRPECRCPGLTCGHDRLP
ncbi:SARP family transcriptional regulator [Actinorhabdospora filicis]|uniref:SARP family transcriptional regulator n=1 Tax=Actinorhabdospora filicis TaxID=1785913 RepID=A0A9W6SL58_9ACTN|nr:BTAD domain-containing putative transcriptional regulator [Actinorhabdospora filicis]GLZ77937.1 SARP family transcriptional regulator [Actinorhabdospora filicis]